MDRETIVLVQMSLKNIAPIADQIGATFYARLFETHPELRPLFAEDIAPQSKKLVQMLAMVVNGLHRLNALKPAIEDLARRHEDYGVVPEHYPVVGKTLIWALEQGLGDAFTPDVKRAWIIAYRTLSRTMIAATHRVTTH